MGSIDLRSYTWQSPHAVNNRSFTCGYCGDRVSSVLGLTLSGGHQAGNGIYICTNCKGPNFLGPQGQYPSPALGKPVEHVPSELNALYEEARRCTSDNCYTAAVLLCRKMLMNIAVEIGAKVGQSFISYVEYLSKEGYVPPNGKHWVDHIRKKGNEATHEISLMNENDAKEILIFVEMLLKFIYEFPKLVPETP